MNVYIKRAYEEAEEVDGVRVLVDRVWPRGVSKERLRIDFWFKDIAPSTELRKWFNHESEKFPEFKKRYKEELQKSGQQRQFDDLKELIKQYSTVTLVYGAKDKLHNQAVVLKDLLEE
ncbi:DUF488 domain-containing protein [Radiobacillus kanasensis]|uniref:DUF488 domain-containing protein n=1 Tax=Radiobacillus kanasensis TaxID=2844358 RepID=UPI001E4ACEA3|nr:DUF488 domain-containing protein [Radiobacillus kanasensis]UFU00279.1 DUF488 domain-containing protein [Radiobacillus kanasensis]